jgi:membrane-associated phospholipid phosphatase
VPAIAASGTEPPPAVPAIAASGTEPAPAVPAPSPEPRVEDYAFEPGVRCPYCAGSPEHPEGRYGLHWHDHWRHVGLAEYIVTPVLFATAAAFGLGVVPDAQKAAWVGPILFDSRARRVLQMESRSGRTIAGAVSDAFLYGTFAQTMVVDDLFVSWALRNAPDVAWQMFVINSEAYALTLSVNAVTKRLAARERPYGDQCADSGGEFSCNGSDRFHSFYSGHSAVTATAAGLVCAHHTQLALYAGPYADAATCAGSVALTLATGVLRIASENHWASDVVAGELVGFASGYVLPTLLYYRHFRVLPKQRAPSHEPRVAVVPMATDQSVQVVAVGVF